ncbi:MAG: hypothetical protein DRQ46_00505 [Gammaproteobacteria bacterium]|nr:MAG: hypothetical protein DRQ46_00505 [Gammaproteobacteria bacterium]
MADPKRINQLSTALTAAASVAASCIAIQDDMSATATKYMSRTELRKMILDIGTNSVALETDGSGNLIASAVTATELNKLDGTSGALVDIGTAQTMTGKKTFDELETTGTTTVADVDINGGEIDATPIGANSASTVAGTTISAATSTTAPLDILGTSGDGYLKRMYQKDQDAAGSAVNKFYVGDFTLKAGERIIGAQIKVIVAMGCTWSAKFDILGVDQEIAATGTSAAANTIVTALFDYNADSPICTTGNNRIEFTGDAAANFDAAAEAKVTVFYESMEEMA